MNPLPILIPVTGQPSSNDTDSSLRGQIQHYKRAINQYTSSTPGQLIQAFSFCLISILLVGTVNAFSIFHREHTFSYIRYRQEPLNSATSTIKSSIERSQVLMNKFTLSPNYDSNLITQYEKLITIISENLTKISVGDPSNSSATIVNTLAPEIARMHGISELIINNKKDNSPFAIYQLRALNKYIDLYIKPMIDELYSQQITYLSETFKKYSKPSYSSLILTVLAYIVLISLSFRLYTMTKRIYNIHLLLTFVLLTCGTAWYLFVTITSSTQVSRGKDSYDMGLQLLSSLNQSITEVIYDENRIIADPLDATSIIGEMDTSAKKIQSIIPELKNSPPAIYDAAQEIARNAQVLVDHAYAVEASNPTANLLVFQPKNQSSFDFTTLDEARNHLREQLRAVFTRAKSYYSFINPLYYLIYTSSIIFLSIGLYQRTKEYR